MIYESGIVSATTADLLASGSRLNSIPYAGKLTLDFLATDNDATNNFTVTIQLPNGDVPVDAQRIPCVNPSRTGSLDERQLIRFTFPAGAGGHFNIILTETGTSTVTWRAVLSP